MAATPSEFYANLLRRGVASYEANRYPDAARQLRIAAFGLVDVVDQYQLAQMYLALTNDKLGLKDRAQDSVHRVIAAERVERKYASVPVTPAVRSAFEALATRLLTPSDLAILRGGPIPPPPPPTSTTTRPVTAVPQTATPPRSTSTAASQTATPPRGTTTVPQTSAQQTSTQQTSTQQTSTPARPPAPQSSQPAIATPAPQSTTPANTAPQTASTAVPAPAKPKPQPPAVKPAVKPPTTTATATTTTAPSVGRGGPVEPARPAAPIPRSLTASEITTRLAAAERALNGANLVDARRGYRELLAAPGLDHDSLIRVAEGLYRALDFASALSTFNRIGTLRGGEEPYRYYVAVAAYETGDYARAKKELAAALPYIEVTADVAHYRTRIEGAQ